MMDAIPGMAFGAQPAVVWLAALGDASLKGLVVLLCAGAATLAARRASAAARHLIWSLALGALLALPILSLVLPAWRFQVPVLMHLPTVVGAVSEPGGQRRAAADPAGQWAAVTASAESERHEQPSMAAGAEGKRQPRRAVAAAEVEGGEPSGALPGADVDQHEPSSVFAGAGVKRHHPSGAATGAGVKRHEPRRAAIGAEVERHEPGPIVASTDRSAATASATHDALAGRPIAPADGTPGTASLLMNPASFGMRLDAEGSAVAAQSPAGWTWFVLGLWLAGALLVLASLGISLLRVRRLRVHAQPLNHGRAANLAVRLALRLGLRRSVVLLEGHGPVMPMTWGLVRPVVLLPAGANGWPQARLEAVLLHELAHVGRGDYATQLLAGVGCALYWFNPLVWLAAHRLRIEREHACDDQVLAAGSKASDYASQLLDLARALRTQRATAMAAIAMARRSQLTGRLLAVLDVQRSRAAMSGRWSLPALLLTVLLIVPLAAASPTATAESTVPETVQPDEDDIQAPAMPAAAGTAAPVVGTVARVPGAPVPRLNLAVPNTHVAVVNRPMRPLLAGGLATATSGRGSSSQCWEVSDDGSSISHNSNDGVETIRWSNGRCDVDVRIEGEIEFTPDFRGIARLSSGGLFRIEEDDGRITRELEVTAGPNGRPVYAWAVDGERRVFDANARAWLSEMLVQFFRSTAYAADERVERILARGGPQGVFDEVGLMHSDYVQRRYLEELLERTELDAAAAQRAVELAGRELESDYALAEVLIAMSDQFALGAPVRQSFIRASQSIGSDYEHRRVLSAALAEGRLSSENVQAVLRSAQAIDSDYELSELLIDLIGRYPVDAPMREAYLAAAGEIGSDYERQRVLSALVARGDLTPDNLAAVINAAAMIDSDYQLAELLVQVSAHDLSSAALQASFLDATTSLGSDYAHRRVLGRLLERESLAPQLLSVVLASAAQIDSDYQAAELLVQVAEDYTLAGPLRDAYLKAADTIGSDYEYGRVASVLLRQRGR